MAITSSPRGCCEYVTIVTHDSHGGAEREEDAERERAELQEFLEEQARLEAECEAETARLKAEFEEDKARLEAEWEEEKARIIAESEVGLYKLNAVDSQLESAWFQPLNLSYQVRNWFQAYQAFAFKTPLVPLRGGEEGADRGGV
jgi:hypothetical protein